MDKDFALTSICPNEREETLSPDSTRTEPPQLMRKLVLAAIICAWMIAIHTWFRGSTGDDLSAIYFAAKFYAEGAYDLIYAYDPSDFRNVGSVAWDVAAKQSGFSDDGWLHPFVQPPLVAAIISPLTQIFDFGDFNEIFRWLHLLAIVATIEVAYRYWRPSLSRNVYFCVVLLLVSTSLPFLFSMDLNQSQPIVLLLMMLALQQDSAGRPVEAGLALACATALKISPAALVLYWIVTRRWRSIAYFCGFAAALAVTTLLVVDYQLIRLFLNRIVELESQIVLGLANVGLQPFLYLIVEGGLIDFSPRPRPEWTKFSAVALLLVVVALSWLRSRGADKLWAGRALAPAFLLTTLVVNPMSWSHYYLFTVLYASTLVTLWGRPLGTPIAALVLILTSAPLVLLVILDIGAPGSTVFLTLAGAVTAIVAALAAPRTKTDPGLPPTQSPL